MSLFALAWANRLFIPPHKDSQRNTNSFYVNKADESNLTVRDGCMFAKSSFLASLEQCSGQLSRLFKNDSGTGNKGIL